LNSLYRRYKDRVAFYLVYIREAHPTDGKQARANRNDGILFAQPTTFDERIGVSTKMCTGLRLDMPALVDGMDDKVAKAYNAFPDRLYLIDVDGVIAYQGPRGPKGFKPEELEASIVKLLDASGR
jgi:hypothetical protein